MDFLKSGFNTRAIHVGQEPEEEFGAVSYPIYQTSTYAQRKPGEPYGAYDYSRAGNPTRTALEQALAALENGKHGIIFSSGLASLAAVIHLLQAGDHVILCDDVYGGTFRCFDKVYQKFGVEYSLVDLTNEEQYRAAFRENTKLVWIETPTNPLLKVIDLEKAIGIAKEHGSLSAVDNTFASPYLQQPLEFGADVVSHSTTKYIGGHSDLIGGALIVNDDDLAEKLHFTELAVGAVPSPFECFLMLRSLKTLGVRMDRHCQNAIKVASFLESHDAIEQVLYPGLPSHPQHEIAKEQMKDFGGMVTVVLKGGMDAAVKMLQKVEIFILAESLGGVESLIEHPAIMTHASVPKEQREALGIKDGLVRLSVGIEEVDDLIDDLKHSLA